MREKQLSIRDDEAYDRAHALAERTGQPIRMVVRDALKAYKPQVLDERDIARRKTIIENLISEIGPSLKPGPQSDDDDWLYDSETGLPR